MYLVDTEYLAYGKETNTLDPVTISRGEIETICVGTVASVSMDLSVHSTTFVYPFLKPSADSKIEPCA